MSDKQIEVEVADDGGQRSRFPRWLKWTLFGALAVLVVGYGLIFLYARVLNDSPDELDEDDLAAALADDEDVAGDPPADGTDGEAAADDPPADEQVEEPPAEEEPAEEPPADEPTDSAPPPDDAQEEPSAEEPPAEEPAGVTAGAWTITEDSELGYRVKEILFGVDTEAVGRTNQVTGGLTIDGDQVDTAEFIVDVASISSDDGRRDSQFRGRIMSADEFPEATFLLTAPIELGTEPVEGASVETSATGELTLRGSTNPVTFDVTARLENGQIGVLGSIPVVFEDYGIANPSFAGVTTEDEGLVEFVLVFAPA